MGKMQESALFVTLKYFEVGMRGEREREKGIIIIRKRACLIYERQIELRSLTAPLLLLLLVRIKCVKVRGKSVAFKPRALRVRSCVHVKMHACECGGCG